MNRTLFEFEFINSTLPPEMWSIIFKFISLTDLINVAKTCKQFYYYSVYDTIAKIKTTFDYNWLLTFGLHNNYCSKEDYVQRHKLVYALQYFEPCRIDDIQNIAVDCISQRSAIEYIKKLQTLRYLWNVYRISKIPSVCEEFIIEDGLFDFTYNGLDLCYAIIFYPGQTGILELTDLDDPKFIDAYLIRNYESRFYSRAGYNNMCMNTNLIVKSIIFYK